MLTQMCLQVSNVGTFITNELAELWKNCSSCAGWCISLGSKFFDSGYREVNDMLLNEKLQRGLVQECCQRMLLYIGLVERYIVGSTFSTHDTYNCTINFANCNCYD